MAWTDAAGHFLLAAEKTLNLLFGHGGWSSVEIAVEHRRYLTLRTNLSAAIVPVEGTKGRPEAQAGTLRLIER